MQPPGGGTKVKVGLTPTSNKLKLIVTAEGTRQDEVGDAVDADDAAAPPLIDQ